jgi:outer membrane lipoprotein-sorting protein
MLSLSHRRALVLCGLACLLVLAGCTGPANSDPDVPTGEEAVEGFSSVGVYNATVISESQIGNETTETRVQRTVRPATGERYQVATVDGNRTITVSNGTTTWIYDPTANTVTVTTIEGGQQANQTSQVRQLFDSIEVEESDGLDGVPIITLFPVSPGSDGGSATETGLWTDPVKVSYEGVETVSGRDAHVVRMQSVDGAETEMEQTLYFDTEYFVVLQGEWEMELEMGNGTEHVEGRLTLQDVNFNPDVDDDIFQFEPPENATISELGDEIQQFERYNELVDAADGPVPAPRTPDDYVFERGSITERAVSLVYTNDSGTLFVTRRTTGGIATGSEPISRDGRTYYYSDRYGSKTVQWRCDGAIYSVGGQFSRDTLFEVAGSVQCPPE